MMNGAYGLASLAGLPLDPRDLAIVLGAAVDAAARTDACVLAGRDRAAVRPRRTGSGIDLLLGTLDDPALVAGWLGLPVGTDALTLAAAAGTRWGAGAATRLAGEWLLVRWDERARALSLLTSACLRDPCLVATDGVRVAVAPDLARLARLGWIDATPDPEMIGRALRTGGPDRSVRRRTILAGVTRLLPGELVVVDAGGLRVETTDAEPPPPLEPLRFDDAMAAIDATIAAIVRRRLAEGGDVGILLSGGLDSSLVAAVAAEQRLPGQRIVCLTSAAPAGSGVADESGWAAAVADHLGLPLVRVAPAPDADIYQPRAARRAGADGPLLAPRHFLYDALEDAALDAGLKTLFEGSFGELTVSAYGAPGRVRAVKAALHRLRARLRGGEREGRGDDPLADYFVRPSAAATAAAVAAPSPWRRGTAAVGAFGYALGFDKVAFRTTAMVDPRLRCHYPFRDRALGRRMAALPADFATRGRVDRAPIRALLAGRVPERIVNRRSKMAFSPTYFTLLEAQASTARDRIAAQRAAGAGEWLDLDWLERRLSDAVRGTALSRETWSRVHATALFADFFRWWPQAVRDVS